MKLLIFSALLSQWVFAFDLLPNKTRESKDLSETALASIWENRKSINFQYYNAESDYKTNGTKSSDVDFTLYLPSVFYQYEGFYFEGAFLYGDAEFKTTTSKSDSDISSPIIRVSRTFNDKWGLSFGFTQQTSDTTSGSSTTESEFTEFELATSVKLNNDFYLGFEYIKGEDNVTITGSGSFPELDYTTIIAAIGYMSDHNNMFQSYELSYTKSDEENETSGSLTNLHDETKLVKLELLFSRSFYEFYLAFDNLKEKNSYDQSDDQTDQITLKTEFLVYQGIYLTPSLILEDKDTTETSSGITTKSTIEATTMGLKVGYRTKLYDISIDYFTKDEEEDSTTSGTTTKYEQDQEVILLAFKYNLF